MDPFFVGSIVTRHDSKHLLIFLWTIIDFIQIPILVNFSSTSLVTTLSFQSAWQSAVTRIVSTRVLSLEFSKLSSEQNSSLRISLSFAIAVSFSGRTAPSA
jgi:hypothetical protein